MGHPALKGLLKVDDVIKDPSIAEELTKECSGCDPYTPYHQKRESCTVCKGTGREPLAIATVAKEISESRNSHRKNGADPEYLMF